MKTAGNIEKFVKNLDLDIDTNTQADKAVLSELLDAQKKSMKQQSAFVLPKIRRTIMKSPITKVAAAATVIIAVLIGINHFGMSTTSALWADVAERFESVPFFKLTIYLGNDNSADAKKIEIWKSQDSRVRANDGDTVVFADFSKEGNEILIFDRNTKQMKHTVRFDRLSIEPVTSNGMAFLFLTLLCKDGQFSLVSLTDSFPPEVRGITPVETVDTAASKETVLFEARHETTPERLKIWALRESKLPIRLCFIDQRKNEYGDFLFDYSEQKDNKFFDPNAFKNQ
jgi:hypothetical protein